MVDNIFITMLNLVRTAFGFLNGEPYEVGVELPFCFLGL